MPIKHRAPRKKCFTTAARGLQQTFMLKFFWLDIIVLLAGMAVAYFRGVQVSGGGASFLISALIIAALEISLSFDNAVINASKLKTMAPIWRRRFLTWGIAIAVFGMRFVFPIVIVAVFSGISCGGVLHLALNDPERYAHYLHEAHIGISSFGGTFLAMLFCEFMFAGNKDLHWIAPAEKFLKRVGKIRFAPALIATLCLLCVQPFLAEGQNAVSLAAGFGGIVAHLFIHGASEKLEKLAERKNAFAVKHAGLAAFLYLELIDASFSLDGVLGAFALTRDVIVIAIGLSVGAFFVRSITLLLVEKHTLEKLVFLTHGAYWAIGALAAVMFVSTIGEIPEVITGLFGMFLILASLASSILYNKRLK